MQTHRWEKVYSIKAFAVTTPEPSQVVAKYAGLIPQGSKVADLGCGHGRNSLFLAKRGHPVEAYDVADLRWYDGAPGVSFQKCGVEDIELENNLYGAVLMMRLIQYLPHDQVERLIQMAVKSLMPGGMLLMSYGVSGGAVNAGVLDVETYSHKIETIRGLLNQSGITMLFAKDEVMPQQSVTISNHSIHACDLVGQKPLQRVSLAESTFSPRAASFSR